MIELDKSSKRFAELNQLLTKQYLQMSKNYDEIINQSPLPSDCYIDDYRLRIINQATNKAATTRESYFIVPTGGAFK